jgi:transcriptional regulator GlxA family with amidase domain
VRDWPSPGGGTAGRLGGVRTGDSIDGVREWALANLGEDLSIEVLARRAFLSTRSFARQFREVTGCSAYAWVLEQRVRLARRLLEDEPGLPLEDVAFRAGFGSAGLLRQHFRRRYGCSPSQYRAGYRKDRMTAAMSSAPCPRRSVSA